MNEKSHEMEVVKKEHQPVALPADPFDQVSLMMQAVVDKGITAENVAALKELTALYQQMEAKRSERIFNEAFNQLQQDMPTIKATEPVPNKDGTVRYRFAPYEDLMNEVSPLLVKHGFTISFSTRYDQGRIIKICTLRHRGGHAVANEFAVRVGHGPPGSSEAQADGAAGTYAKRLALCDALNIVVEKDTDARNLGDTVTKEQAASLRRRVQATGSDEIAFLKYAQAQLPANPTAKQVEQAYGTIPEVMLNILDSSLRKKESTK
jgi:hypothetical protein